jgi:hypothetical protein
LTAKRWHDLLMGLLLLAAVLELLVLPICKVCFGHAILPWLQR